MSWRLSSVASSKICRKSTATFYSIRALLYFAMLINAFAARLEVLHFPYDREKLVA